MIMTKTLMMMLTYKNVFGDNEDQWLRANYYIPPGLLLPAKGLLSRSTKFSVQLKHSVLVYQGTARYLNPRHNNHHHHHHHHHPEKQHWGNILKAFIGCRHSQ